jgi:hypothetical protein
LARFGVHRFGREIGGGPGLMWRGGFRPFCMSISLEGRWFQTARTRRKQSQMEMRRLVAMPEWARDF